MDVREKWALLFYRLSTITPYCVPVTVARCGKKDTGTYRTVRYERPVLVRFVPDHSRKETVTTDDRNCDAKSEKNKIVLIRLTVPN